MAKSETITTRAPNAGKKTPAKASHSRQSNEQEEAAQDRDPKSLPHGRQHAVSGRRGRQRLAAVHGLSPARKSISILGTDDPLAEYDGQDERGGLRAAEGGPADVVVGVDAEASPRNS